MKRFTLALAALVCLPLLSFETLGPKRQLVDLDVFTEKRKTYFRGTWMMGKDAQSIKVYEDPDAMKAGMAEMSGYALRDIAIQEGKDEQKFYAVYDKNSTATKMIITYSWDDFKKELATEEESGYSIADFDHYSYMGLETFIGVLHQNSKKTEIVEEKSWGKISKEIEKRGSKKNRLMDLDRANIGGDMHYVAFFTEGDKPSIYKCFKLTNKQAYIKQVNSKAKKGYIALESDGFEQGNAVAHLVVFVKKPQPYALEVVESWEDFQEKFNGYAQ